MKALVLLSESRHPVSGKPCLSRLEAQAARMATILDPTPAGLHAGPGLETVREALGRGLAHLIHLACAVKDDPVPALAAAVREAAPDVVLAGPRGEGGADTGLLPYALAFALGWPLVPDAVTLSPGADAGTLGIEQALPRGARRRVLVRLPVLVSVHPGAPAPLPFAYARARAGGAVTRAPAGRVPVREEDLEERPYRPRPKVMAQAGLTAAERVAALSGGSTRGRVLVDPAPEEAAREILSYLRGLGLAGARSADD